MAESTRPPVLDLRGVRKIYGEGEGEVRAVDALRHE